MFGLQYRYVVETIYFTVSKYPKFNENLFNFVWIIFLIKKIYVFSRFVIAFVN